MSATSALLFSKRPRRIRTLERDGQKYRTAPIIAHADSQPARLHHLGVGAVRADADRSAARWPAGARLSRRARAVGARGGDALSADAKGLPARPRPLSRCDRGRCRDSAAHRRDRRRGRGRARLCAGGGRRHRGSRARPAEGARSARPETFAHAPRASVGAAPRPADAGRGAAHRQPSRRRVRARRRSCPPDRRHDDARRCLGPAR